VLFKRLTFFLLIFFGLSLGGCLGGEVQEKSIITPTVENLPPEPTAPKITTNMNAPASVLVEPNDPDNKQGFTFTIATDPQSGVVVINRRGRVTYTPDENFVGRDSLTVAVIDNGTPSAMGLVTIDVRVKPLVTVSVLKDHLFKFLDGSAFADGLKGEQVELTFGNLNRNGKGPFTLLLPNRSGALAASTSAEGTFRLVACSFLIDESQFDPEDFPELQAGMTLYMQPCELESEAGELVLTNSETGAESISNLPRPRFSFVIIFTDDQRWDTLWAMPIVQETLVSRGVTFTNAYVTTPACCPVRASILSGGYYAKNTEVLTNGQPNGGVRRFQDTETLAVYLQNAGYKTSLIGKYMNGYQGLIPYIPPGWTQFIAQVRPPDWFSFPYVAGRSGFESSVGRLRGPTSKYITDFQKDRSLAFLDEYGDRPFFLFLSTHAPHGPATPAAEDVGLFRDYEFRGRAYAEKNLRDKPDYVRTAPALNVEGTDTLARNQLRSLQAVDRAVGEIVQKISDMGKMDQTVFIFTSDNGYLWGEHNLFGKSKPYEESIRVPLVVVMPEVEPRKDDHLIAINLDLGPTLFALSGLSRETDGLSLIPLLEDPETPWREEILLESYALATNDPFVWAGLRTKEGDQEWKYVEYATGEIELYDLVNDQHETQSKHGDIALQGLIEGFSAHLASLVGPAILSAELPDGVEGVPYQARILSWGCQGGCTWSIVEGQLPEGLYLEPSLGLIGGVPEHDEMQEVSIRVESKTIASYTRRPQSFIWKFIIRIR
jgi:arylsulfatase A-like enzyme